MPKVIAPLYSLTASGTLAHRLTFSASQGANVVRWNATHHAPRSIAQIAHGARVAECRAAWRALSEVVKSDWNATYSWSHLSGPAIFLREWFAQDIFSPNLPTLPV
jgi:hypothetical protein